MGKYYAMDHSYQIDELGEYQSLEDVNEFLKTGSSRSAPLFVGDADFFADVLRRLETIEHSLRGSYPPEADYLKGEMVKIEREHLHTLPPAYKIHVDELERLQTGDWDPEDPEIEYHEEEIQLIKTEWQKTLPPKYAELKRRLEEIRKYGTTIEPEEQEFYWVLLNAKDDNGIKSFPPVMLLKDEKKAGKRKEMMLQTEQEVYSELFVKDMDADDVISVWNIYKLTENIKEKFFPELATSKTIEVTLNGNFVHYMEYGDEAGLSEDAKEAYEKFFQEHQGFDKITGTMGRRLESDEIGYRVGDTPCEIEALMEGNQVLDDLHDVGSTRSYYKVKLVKLDYDLIEANNCRRASAKNDAGATSKLPAAGL